VVAVEITERIGAADLGRYIDAVEAAVASDERTHLFVELIGIGSIEVDELRPFLGRWLALLGKLKRFGRIALVSDTAWLRWAAKLESALLPYVSYQTFRPEEREQALAWVKGERARPRGPSIRIIETSQPDVLGFELEGKLVEDELHAIALHFNERLKNTDGPLRMLGRIKRLDGFELSGVFDRAYLAMKRGMLDRLERYALVGGPDWLASWVRALDPVFRVEIRHFPADQEALAWAWLGAEPKAERPLVA
jgi:hypothetical protein